MNPYRNSNPIQHEYLIVTWVWTEAYDGLVDLLNDHATNGWRPILMSDGGGATTIILERLKENGS